MDSTSAITVATTPASTPAAPLARYPALGRRLAGVRRSEIRDLLAIVEEPGVLSLAGGLPAADALPSAQIGLALERVLDRTSRNGPVALQYGPTEGLEELRTLLAPGTAGSPALGPVDRVLVTTGSQQALELVVRAVVDPGDRVVVEDPLYLGTRQVLDGYGAELLAIPVDRDGLDVDRLATELAAGARPKLAIVVPNFSNPSGASLPSARRAELGALAQRYGFLIVEDDAYHGLSFGGPPPAPVATHAPDHTVTIGSASKMIAPGLRVGFLGAPAWLYPALVALKQGMDLHTPTLSQLVVADLLTAATALDEHLRTVRRAYADRATTLRDALAEVVGTAAPGGGMFLWGRTATDTRTAFGPAVAAGVAYVPGDAFTVATDGRHHLRLSFATLSLPDLRTAAARLRSVLGPGI